MWGAYNGRLKDLYISLTDIKGALFPSYITLRIHLCMLFIIMLMHLRLAAAMPLHIMNDVLI